jgi:hypothetical protein
LFVERGQKKLVIGGGFVGVIKKIKIFSYPKIKGEAMLNMRLASKETVRSIFYVFRGQ